MNRHPLTVERLRSVLSYDATTGEFRWIVKIKGRRIGDRAGRFANSHGYATIRIDGVTYGAHRLAWLYTTGEWPQNEIDHINGNRGDNRLVNLRDVTRAINQQNQRVAKSHNGSGMLGVSRYKNGKFTAQIRVNKTKRHLGYFETAEEAHAAYMRAKRDLHKEAMLP